MSSRYGRARNSNPALGGNMSGKLSVSYFATALRSAAMLFSVTPGRRRATTRRKCALRTLISGSDVVISAAEPPLPEPIRDQRHVVATLRRFLRQKIAAAHRLHSKRRQQ